MRSLRVKLARKPARSLNSPALARDHHVVLAAGRSARRGCRARPPRPARRDSPAWRRRSGSSANVAPARRGSSVQRPGNDLGCSRSVASQLQRLAVATHAPARRGCRPPAGLRSCAARRRCRCARRWRTRSRRPACSPAAAAAPAGDRPASPPRRARRPGPGPGPGRASTSATPARACRGCTTPLLAISWPITLRARLVGNREAQADVAGHRCRCGLKLAVLMPTSSPCRLTSAPPELPGLIEASVWMKFWKPRPRRPLRPTAETMPEVTVWPMPNGLPTATTKSPTRSASESASGSAVRLRRGDAHQGHVGVGVGADELGLEACARRPASPRPRRRPRSRGGWSARSRAAASTITPEPSDSLIRSCGQFGKHAPEHRVVAERADPHPSAWCAR